MSYRYKFILSSQERSLYNVSNHLIALSLNIVIDSQDLTCISFLQGDPIFYLEQLSRDLVNHVFYYYQTLSYLGARVGLGFSRFTLEFYQEFSVVDYSIDVVLSSLDRALSRAVLGRGISFYYLYYNTITILLLLKYFKDLRGVVSLSGFQPFSSFKLTLLFLFTQRR